MYGMVSQALLLELYVHTFKNFQVTDQRTNLRRRCQGSLSPPKKREELMYLQRLLVTLLIVGQVEKDVVCEEE
jgi:hypothetical protein